MPITLTLGTATAASGIQDGNGIFSSGDWAWLVDPNGANQEAVRIQSVSGNTITLGPTTMVTPGGTSNPVTQRTHVSGAFGVGTFILLKTNANDLIITFEDGVATQWLYIGNAWNMTANVYRIAKLAGVAANAQPYTWNVNETSAGGPFDTSEIWVLGTSTSEYFVASALIA